MTGETQPEARLRLDPEQGWGDELARELERLSVAASERDEPSLWSLVSAANEIAGEWLESCDRLVAARGSLARAQRAEAASGDRLRSLLGLIQASMDVPDPSAADLEASCAPTSEPPAIGGPHVDAHDDVPAAAPAATPSTIEYTRPTTAPTGGGSGSAPAEPFAPTRNPPVAVAAERFVDGASGSRIGPRARPERPATAGHGSFEAGTERPAARDAAGHAAPDTPAVAGSAIRSPSATGHLDDVPAPSDDGLAIFLFGRVRILLDGAPVELCIHGKALRLFRYLLAHRTNAIPKDVLIELLWPDADIDNGRRGLHQAVYTIRKSLRGADPKRHLIVFEDDAYRINPTLSTWCDVEEFERHVELAQQADARGDERRAHTLLRRAEELWTADFAEDAPYEDWALTERERLRLMYVEAVKRLSELSESVGDMSDALEVSQRALAVEPCDEASHRRIMRCHALAGNRHLAVRQYQACVDQLDRTYGLEPSTQTVDLYQSLVDPSAVAT